MNDNSSNQTLVQPNVEKKQPRWGKTSPPGIRQDRAGVFFLNKFIRGKYYGESLETANKKIAITKALKRIEELERLHGNPNVHQDPDQLTFSQLITDYKRQLALRVATGQATKKTQVYRERTTLLALIRAWDGCPAIKAAGLEGFEKLNPDRVRLPHCQEWMAYLVGLGYCPQLVNNTLSDFRTLFDLAINSYNPTLTNWPRKLKRVPVPIKRVTLPTEEEWQVILGHLRKPKYPNRWTQHTLDLIEVLAFTGLRLHECTLVEARHVDLEKNAVFIPKEHRKGRLGKKEDLNVPIFPQARPLFERLVKDADPDTGRIIQVGKAYKTLKTACAAAGFPDLTHHDLRKFLATRLLLKGHSPSTVAALLGHRDGGYLAMTIYSQISTRHLDGLKDTVYFGADPAHPAGV